MKIYVLDHGYLEADEAWLVPVPNPATVKNKNAPAQWVSLPSLTFLIDHPEGKILFDTGCHPDLMERLSPEARELFVWYYKEEELLANRLKKIGLTPSDIDNVVMSHLHFDHAGGLYLFKHANIFVSRVELEKALFFTHVSPKGEGEFYLKADFDIPGLTFTPISDDTELFEGIELIVLEGHAPGILGMVVHLENTGTFICPSDAIRLRRNYGPPPVPPLPMYDSLGFFRTVEKVRKLEKKYKAKIFYSHDLEEFKGYRVVPEYYD